jgi:site-specific recombinase XerD
MDSMPIEEEWLSQILGEQTRKTYTRSLKLFKEFMHSNSTEDLINFRKRERNFETRVIQFYKWLQESREITSNSARAYCIALQSLFSYVSLPLKLKNKLPKTHMKIESWRPSLENLQGLFRLGNVSVKAWLRLEKRECGF